MFKLVKILGGRTNQSESRTVKVSPLTQDIMEGAAISICSGVVTVINEETTCPVTHIVDAPAKQQDTSILVTDVLPGMIFSTPFVGSMNDYNIYEEHCIGMYALSPAIVETPHSGAVIYDIPVRKKGYDLLVTFPAN